MADQASVGLKQSIDYEPVDVEFFSTSLEAIINGLWLHILVAPKEMTTDKARNYCLAFLASTFPHHLMPDNKNLGARYAPRSTLRHII